MKGLINKSGLTKKEITVLLFLILTFSAGLIVKYSGWKAAYEFDYSESDSKFESEVKKSFRELESQSLDSNQQKRLVQLDQFTDSLYGLNEKKSNRNSSKLPAQKININLALTGDLQQLPGIGTAMAERIIEYREQNGKFIKAEDLMKVKGIGEKKFEKIKEFIVTR